MRILIIRHAHALDLDEMPAPGAQDFDRSLSPKGFETMRRAAQALTRVLAQIDRILSSPYVRTVQTAEILRDAFPAASFKTLPALEAGASPKPLLENLGGYGADETIAVVGHAPDVSAVLSHGGRCRHYRGVQKGQHGPD
jgi:phosphohistidine phosphatase